ncbi:MAG: M28 family peptidase [bacterium]|nr:M28 family peptidase [bacterium]
MMVRVVRIVLLLALLPVVAAASTPAGRLTRAVDTLTAPALAGRGAGTPGARAAADTLAAWLAAGDCDPAFDGDWFQELDLAGTGWEGQDLTGLRDRNVAGIRRGRGELARRWIVLGAHFDHLGRTDPDGTGSPPAGGFYPGANDNASGVAVVREVLRALAKPAGEARSLLVVFFAAEEAGLQGSAHFVAEPPVPLAAVDAMVNLDTVGRTHDGRLFVSGVDTAPALRSLVESVPLPGPEIALSLAAGGWSGSDHMSFNTREVPVLFLFGGPYPEYNRPADTRAVLDLEAMVRVADWTTGLVERLRTARGDFAWTMVGDGPLRPGAAAATGDRATWLGTLPDFTEDVAGYKLAGVFDGSPAAAAGLEKGDVLVRLGGSDVTDLATFTRALRAHPPGSLVEIELRRGERRLNFTVVLGNRADRR